MGTHQNEIIGQQEFSNSLATNNGHKNDGIMGNKNELIGVLEVFIEEARNIHNICIYHKQDVYAKIFMTSNPESTESTRIVNGGGQNPVFKENFKIQVRTGGSSLRCEIWMLSRIKNYLEDQLLGFTLVPMNEILVENGKLEREFELSTSELFHSPSGFVKLSIIYSGSSPDVMEIKTLNRCLRDRVCSEIEAIEFPDPKIVNENEIMVSEYYSTCTEIESQSVVSGQSQITENDDSFSSDSNDHTVSNSESLEKKEEKRIMQSDICVKGEKEQKLVQKEIVDMYLKSMNQFTEALAKMNLPMDKGNGSPDDGKESKGNGSKGEGPNPKVFYGSRAFF